MVYRGGLENRFGRKPNGGSNPSLSASFAERNGIDKIVSDTVKIVIWVVVIGGVFALLWKQGHIARFANYLRETREELRKCTWPTWDELKGQTALVAVAVLLLGAFTVAVDVVFAWLLNSLT